MTSTMQNEVCTAHKMLPVDDSLMRLVASGDRDAFAELYRRTDSAVYGFILSILKNRHDAEDVMQGNLPEHQHRECPPTRRREKPMAWILTIARNLARMKLREQGRTSPADLNELEIPVQPDNSSEDRVVLEAALRLLTGEERQIVMLHAVAGLKHRETAELLELPAVNGTFKIPAGAKETEMGTGRKGGGAMKRRELEQRLSRAVRSETPDVLEKGPDPLRTEWEDK